jgi:hypothetical protein
VLWVGSVVGAVWHDEPFEWIALSECVDTNPPTCTTSDTWLHEILVVTQKSGIMALVPPALVLMIGLAFGWALRGFQKGG